MMRGLKTLLVVMLVMAMTFWAYGCGLMGDEEVDLPEDINGEVMEDEDYLTPINGDEDDEEMADIFDSVYVTVTAPSVNLRSGPGTDFDIVKGVTEGEELEVEFFLNHWIKVRTEEGTEAFVAGWLTDENLPEPDEENLRNEEVEEVY